MHGATGTILYVTELEFWERWRSKLGPCSYAEMVHDVLDVGVADNLHRKYAAWSVNTPDSQSILDSCS